MSDHLSEARRMANSAGGGSTLRILDNLQLAIKHLADAIEELRPTINPELTVQPETVPTLLPEHRDRVWQWVHPNIVGVHLFYRYHVSGWQLSHDRQVWDWCVDDGDRRWGTDRLVSGEGGRFTVVSDGAL